METDTSKNAAMENQPFKSFKFKLHDKLCHGVFPLFIRTNVTFFLEKTINDTQIFCMVMALTDLPIKANVDKYKRISFAGEKQSGQVPFFTMIFQTVL